MIFIFLNNKTKIQREGVAFRKDLSSGVRSCLLTEDIGLQPAATPDFVSFGLSFLARLERGPRKRTVKKRKKQTKKVILNLPFKDIYVVCLSCWFGAACFCAFCTCPVLSISIFYHVDVLLKLCVWCLFQCSKICCAYKTASAAF